MKENPLMKDYASDFYQILSRYDADLHAMNTHARPADGLFGLGRRRGDDPCHDVMDQAVQDLLTRLCADPDAVDQAPGILRLLLEAESARSWPDHARWMLIAAQRHGLLLVPLLSAADAAALASWYEGLYRRADRFPVQRDLLRALRRREKENP